MGQHKTGSTRTLCPSRAFRVSEGEGWGLGTLLPGDSCLTVGRPLDCSFLFSSLHISVKICRRGEIRQSTTMLIL